ncbi:MAG: YbaB/EbfC family nucleoid-associated protein [Chlamydiae bacterium]|jgi:DNA-binding YbaB/EbfC family protein|nr:YbaB/EbfC family nucleoid-associated protein [Chlamydiota bacterium]
MGSGYSKMKKQAKMLSEQFNKAQEQLKTQEVLGTAGNGLVTVKLNGEKSLLKISIKKECVDPNDVEALEDLIQAAFEDASSKLQDEPAQMNGLPEGFSFPF